jgi:NADH:ubiquinone oxidoreductase subunit F (NADH-binding)
MSPPRAPRALPRVLAGIHEDRPLALSEHLAVHGPAGAPRDLAAACEAAGLRGRGGALFPTAVKLRAVAEARGRPTVVVNAAEGEPMSDKDRLLLEAAPHLVLDGAVAAARAVGAREVVVATPTGAGHAQVAVSGAIAERDDGLTIRSATVPDAFLTGEETALIQALEGRPARPTTTPPLPAQRGLRRRPTLVQNAETLAHLALVARHGPEWFRALGTPDHPGSTLVTLGGAVGRPGVYEVALGTRLGDLVDHAGGPTEPLRAVLLGGYHGTWVDAEDIAGLSLHQAALTGRGLTLGAGVVVALPQSACPVTEVARVMDWLAAQTAGQCGPCVYGLTAIAGEVAELRRGRSDLRGMGRLERWSGMVAGRGACHHPDGTTRFLAGALRVFEAEFELHRRFGACEACRARPLLDLPASAALAA